MPPAPDVAADPLAESRRRALLRVFAGLASLGCVILYGTAGYVAQGWSLGDALFMVFITISTVGFGEVQPLDTPWERVHTVLVIGLGILSTGYAAAGLLQFITEGEVQRLLGQHRLRHKIETLRGHVIVAGMGRMGTLVCTELEAAGVPFVLIDRAYDRVHDLEGRGWLAIVGDATEEKVLREAGLDRARALISAVPNDAENVFITLTAHELVPDVLIVARAELPSTEKKLRQAGAGHVVLPAAIGAHRIVSLLTNPSAVEFTELVTSQSSLAIEMDEVTVLPGGPFAGRTLREVDIGRRTGVMVIAVKRTDGRIEFPPSGDEPFAPGDAIVLLGRRPNLDAFRTEFGA